MRPIRAVGLLRTSLVAAILATTVCLSSGCDEVLGLAGVADAGTFEMKDATRALMFGVGPWSSAPRPWSPSTIRPGVRGYYDFYRASPQTTASNGLRYWYRANQPSRSYESYRWY